MNLSVKILNRIDPPVTTMELVWVRMVRLMLTISFDGFTSFFPGHYLALQRVVYVRTSTH